MQLEVSDFTPFSGTRLRKNNAVAYRSAHKLAEYLRLRKIGAHVDLTVENVLDAITEAGGVYQLLSRLQKSRHLRLTFSQYACLLGLLDKLVSDNTWRIIGVNRLGGETPQGFTIVDPYDDREYEAHVDNYE